MPAGLVVAADSEHARRIAALLREATGRVPVVVLHAEARAAAEAGRVHELQGSVDRRRQHGLGGRRHPAPAGRRVRDRGEDADDLPPDRRPLRAHDPRPPGRAELALHPGRPDPARSRRHRRAGAAPRAAPRREDDGDGRSRSSAPSARETERGRARVRAAERRRRAADDAVRAAAPAPRAAAARRAAGRRRPLPAGPRARAGASAGVRAPRAAARRAPPARRPRSAGATARATARSTPGSTGRSGSSVDKARSSSWSARSSGWSAALRRSIGWARRRHRRVRYGRQSVTRWLRRNYLLCLVA